MHTALSSLKKFPRGLLFLSLLASAPGYALPLNFSATLVEGTCALSLDKNILSLGTVTISQLRPATLLAAQPFVLSVDSCTNVPVAGLIPKIKISGDGIDKNKWLFRNSSSDTSTAGVGVVVYRSDTTPAYNASEIRSGNLISLGGVGSNPTGQQLHFYAGLSCGNVCSSIQAGKVAATVLFEFVYE